MAITGNEVWCHLVDHNFKALDLPFRVEIEDGAMVADVRKKVMAIYQIIPPRRLFVWRCKDPFLRLDPADDDSVDQVIGSIDFRDQTKATKLGGGLNVIELGLAEYEVLLVQAEAQTDEIDGIPDTIPELPEYQRYNTTLASNKSTPSESEHGFTHQDPLQAIYNGLAPEFASSNTVAPPIHLYHPIFDEFTSLAKPPESQVAIDDQVQVLELMRKMSVIYEDESANPRAVNPILGKLLGFELMDDVHTVPFLRVVKSSIESSVDLSTQAGVSMRRYWIDSSRRSTLEKCCCPTFIIAASGPWFCVFGAIFTDKIIVQPLTDLRWSALSSTVEESRILENARIFVALRTCLNKLKEYYTNVVIDGSIPPLRPNIPHPRFFPYPTSFTKADGSEVKFEYIKPMEDLPTCVTFLVQTIGDSSAKKVVVKFVSRYGRVVHEYLATKNRAPKLYYYRSFPSPTDGDSLPPLGGMKMVVMEYIDSKPNSDQDIPANTRKQLEEILTDLHSQGLVFGDLRWPNIIFDKSNRAFLIDFNWGGRYDTKTIQDRLGIPKGVQKDVWENIKARVAQMESVDFDGVYARYPLAISQVEGMWVDGVGPGELILPRHDWGMLDKLDFSYQ